MSLYRVLRYWAERDRQYRRAVALRRQFGPRYHCSSDALNPGCCWEAPLPPFALAAWRMLGEPAWARN